MIHNEKQIFQRLLSNIQIGPLKLTQFKLNLLKASGKNDCSLKEQIFLRNVNNKFKLNWSLKTITIKIILFKFTS